MRDITPRPLPALGFGAMAIARARREWAFAFACTSAAIIMAYGPDREAPSLRSPELRVGWSCAALPAFDLRGAGGAVGQPCSSERPSRRSFPRPIIDGLFKDGRRHDQRQCDDRTDRPFGRRDRGDRTAPSVRLWRRPNERGRTVFRHWSAHNSVLQVTLAWGLVGLACLVIIAVAYGRRALPVVRTEGRRRLARLHGDGLRLLILSLYDGSLYYPLPQSILRHARRSLRRGGAASVMAAGKWRPRRRRRSSRRCISTEIGGENLA